MTQFAFNNEQGWRGFQEPDTSGSDDKALSFYIWSLIARISTATLVKVESVTNAGSDSPVGFVSVQPMINQTDGAGNSVQHGIIYECPYFRLQGGSNAIILDPQVGDIGLMVFADRDISSVIANKAVSNPGSRRRFDMADGLYIGGMLNGTPTQFVEFSATGITITSPNNVTVNAPVTNVNSTTATITASGTATIKAANILLQNAGSALKTLLNSTLLTWLNSHVHGNGNGGANTTGPTTTPAASTQTTIVQAE